MYTLEFQINALTASPNTYLGSHWRVRSRHADKWKRLVWQKVWHLKPAEPLKKAAIELERWSPRKMDADNARSSFKPVVDALVKWGVLADDSVAVIGEPKVTQMKSSMKDKKIVVRVREVACAE